MALSFPDWGQDNSLPDFQVSSWNSASFQTPLLAGLLEWTETAIVPAYIIAVFCGAH